MSESNITAISSEFDRSNMFEPLLRADPDFVEKWVVLEQEYRSDCAFPLYLVLSELACHLIQNLELGNTHRFHDVFEVVENWHTKGDQYVKEAATIGLLEDLQNGHLHSQARAEDFLPWLRPNTLEWWMKVQEFWASGRPIV